MSGFVKSPGERGQEEVAELLGRVGRVVLLASEEVQTSALCLAAALHESGLEVLAGVEGAAQVGRRLDAEAVLILGAAPRTDAFARGGPLEVAASAMAAAMGRGAPVRSLTDTEALLARLKRRRLQRAVLRDGDPLEPQLERCPELARGLLHKAAREGRAKDVRTLLKRCAWDSLDTQGRTAGDLAFAAGHEAVFELLVDAGSLGVERAPKRRRWDFLHESLTFSGDRLLDAAGRGVMMGWEMPLMAKHAELLLPKPGLQVLNVGFGLGLVDGQLQGRRPRAHHIIEPHPDVLQEMKRRGWPARPGVRVHEGSWQDVVAGLPDASFDAIFFDTWGDSYLDLQMFMARSARLLRDGGRFSYFNGLAPHSIFFHAVYSKMAQQDLKDVGLNCEFLPVHIGALTDEIWQGVSEKYWQFETYYLPLAHQQLDIDLGAGWRKWQEFAVRVGDNIGHVV